MDPSIMKLLEEDEDESMHSAPEVDAFQAALNRDIGGGVSTSMPSDSGAAVVSQGSSHTSSQAFLQWQNACQDENTNGQSQQDLRCEQKQEWHSSEMEQMPHGSASVNEQLQSDAPQKPSSHPLQQGQSQDDSQQGKVEQIPSPPPQTTEMQISEKNIIPIREPDRVQNPDSESQYLKLQKMSNQQAAITEKASNPATQSKQVPFALLLPALLPQLDKDRAMQLRKLYSKLRNNEIPKDGFVRLMKSIVGDQMLRLAVTKLPQQPSSNQSQSQSQVSTQQHHHMRMPSVSASATMVTDSHLFAQSHQKGHISPTQVQADLKHPTIENNAKRARGVEHQSNSHGMQVSQLSSSSSSAVNKDGEPSSATIQGLNKQQQQNFHFTQTSFPVYGNSGGKYNPHSVSSVNSPASSLKPQLHESQMRQIPLHQGMGSTQLGGPTHAMNTTSAPKFERQNSINDPKTVQGGPLPHFVSNSTLQQNSVPWQLSAKDQNCGPLSLMSNVKQESVDQANVQQQKSQSSTPHGWTSISSAQTEKGIAFSAPTSVVPSNSVSSSMAAQVDPNVPLGSRIPPVTSPAGINVRTPPKRPIGQKKPLEALGSSPPPPSKKTKVTVTFLDQSIEQLNDVTAVSGVNLREEEEQLFSGPKEDSRVSDASRRAVQEEEERLILQKTSLKKKLAEIITKCGVKGISSDVERCLSLCVEERMRGLISNLIRLSKQRVDTEKLRHRTVITSDVHQQIMIMNRKAREEWEKKQAEAEKLRKLNEPEDNNAVDDDKEMQPIPPPLLDRMEVIELPGYTPEEKLKIAMRHLIPRVLDQHGLSSEFLQIPEDMVKLVIQRYTREAGVRNLERNLAALARAAAVRVAEQEQAVPLSKDVHQLDSPLLDNRLADGAEVEMEVIPMGVNNHEISNTFRIASPLVVDEAVLEKVLGPPRFDDREAEERVASPGISVGLVWTTFGGEVQFVEATAMVGKGELHLTGQLGDIIKESAQIALTWVRARAKDLKLAAAEEINLLDGRDIHIHFPAGAVPKDGPSAGVTLVTALVSLFCQKRVRADTAMTGEMTLRGLVLPVGGIKDKILAAHRSGIKRVILPERNLKDVVEVPSTVLASMEIVLAKRMEDVLDQAFEGGCPWRQCSKL